ARLDARLVHEGAVVVADLLLGGAGGGVGGGRALDDVAHALLGKIIQPVERPVAGLVCGDGEVTVPGAVGVGEEIIAGLDACITRREVYPEAADRRLRRRGVCRRRGDAVPWG